MAGNTRDETLKFQFEAKETGITEVGKSLDDVGHKSVEAGNFFEFFKKHLEEIISIAAAVELALKAIDFGKDSLKSAEAVEVSLSRVKALAGEAAGAFGEMDDAVEKAATAVNVTTQTSASGLAALVGQGLNAKDAIAALIPTLQLAKIANIDVGTAAEEVAKQLNAFNLPASDAQKVVDELTSASHGAAGGLAAMSGAATALAPDAKTLSLSFTDVVSILGVLNSKGLDTEKSVRGLRTIFQELQNPTSKLRGELLALGDGTSDFGTAITALSANTPRAHEALLTLSGPSRTLVELLGQAGPDAIAKFNAGLQQTQGFAGKTATALDDNLKGASIRFGNAIDLIGEKLAKPVLEPFNKELTKLAGELTAFANSPDFKDIEKDVGEMARNAAEALDKFLHGIDWKSFIADGKDAVKGLVDDFAKLAKSAEDVASAVNKTFDAVGAVYHAAAAGVHGAAAVISEETAGFADHVAGAVLTLDKLTGHSTDAAVGLHAVATEMRSVAEDNAGDFSKHVEGVGADLKDIAESGSAAADSTKKVGDAASDAAPKVKSHADATKETVAGVSNLTAVLQPVPKLIHDSTDSLPEFAAELRAAAASMGVVKDSTGKVVTGTEALTTAFNKLHVSSQQELKAAAIDAANFFAAIDKGSANTAAGLADRQNAFLAYAQKALAASAFLDQGARDAVQYQLEEKATALGVTDALASLEKQAASTAAAVVDSANRGEAALRAQRVEAERQRIASANAAQSAQMAGEAAAAAADKAEKGFTEWGDAADAAALSTQHITADTSHANESMDGLKNGIQAARSAFLGVSEAAANAYDTILKGAFDLGHSSDGSGLDRVARAMQVALDETNEKIAQQRVELQQSIGMVNEFGAAGAKAFDANSRATDAELQSMQALSASIKDGSYQFGILGKQELGPLQAALDGAIQRAEALKAAAEQATQQISDLGNQLKDERDQQLGDQTSIENRRYQDLVKKIEDLASKASAAGKAQAQEDLRLAEQIHQKRLKDIVDEAAAQAKASNPTSQGSAVHPNGSASGGSAPGGGVTGNGGAGIGLQPIHIHVDGQHQTTLYGNEAAARIVASLLADKHNSI